LTQVAPLTSTLRPRHRHQARVTHV